MQTLLQPSLNLVTFALAEMGVAYRGVLLDVVIQKANRCLNLLSAFISLVSVALRTINQEIWL